MTYAGLIKGLDTPPDWTAPTVPIYEDIRAEAITRDHLQDDVRGINASIDVIRRTRGGKWPSEPVAEDFNYVDLVWHECEFRDRRSFTYAVYADQQYLGCAYLSPMGVRKPLTKELLGYDVDVSWWVTPQAYERGLYSDVYDALRHWLATEFPFVAAYYSNIEAP